MAGQRRMRPVPGSVIFHGASPSLFLPRSNRRQCFIPLAGFRFREPVNPKTGIRSMLSSLAANLPYRLLCCQSCTRSGWRPKDWLKTLSMPESSNIFSLCSPLLTFKVNRGELNQKKNEFPELLSGFATVFFMPFFCCISLNISFCFTKSWTSKRLVDIWDWI